MAEEITSNSYEEARKQQLLENQKRFEELGILKITKSLSDISKSEKKSKQREVKLKIRNSPITEPRRSTRERNPIVSYHDDVDIGLPSVRRSKSNSSWASYLARPLEEVKMARYEERVKAMKSAEKLQSNLQSEFPSFVKSMLRSHVYSCFWLGLPLSFCKTHLPKSTVNMILEDEDGNEYDCVFISERTGISGGWRAFALEHKLDDGDALVFELVEPKRFKIHVVKASDGGSVDDDDGGVEEEEDVETKKPSRGRPKKRKTTDESPKENGKKSTAKKGGQHEKPKKSNETVMGTRRSTRGVKN
ncbi:putative B3 domain-containing protein At5g58280 [Lactuca sativa]|uniref:putative B3 domain-containing protein At5g58280 n=1 Tax=Lactuca sativa TaxID=4236 RepID=UPI000CD7E44E|nr:putative B3 domain-containing protein At5g58280 [Lactuca sativa]XP_023728862.1 putative B3 domain-containing protein At5g58280 [Lactuca sativa]XP_023728863.1 putative B3 domain-containing protein At5g58280 [Lactuca sativa]